MRAVVPTWDDERAGCSGAAEARGTSLHIYGEDVVGEVVLARELVEDGRHTVDAQRGIAHAKDAVAADGVLRELRALGRHLWGGRRGGAGAGCRVWFMTVQQHTLASEGLKGRGGD